MMPLATYRLQFRDGMTFDRAAEIAPYLARLGVSHLYASPIFAAATGSTHGYDVIDHNEFDPMLGGREGFERLSRALRDAGLGLILDLVPNHMAASLENKWWRSVVEWGQASPYANHFDIDWREKLTLPMLGRSYGEALAGAELAVKLDADHGGLALAYFDHLLPLDPRSYGRVLAQADGELAAALVACSEQASPDGENQMHDAISTLLADRQASERLEEQLSRLSKNPGFIDKVHSNQPWQLHFWKDARKHLSYRRFFEVTGLVGVRVEDEPVFDDVHRLALELVRSGQVDGLRIDHVDGLADPRAYLHRLRDAVGPDIFIIVEKILARDEALPIDWPISGTTGYEFITAIADALVDASGSAELDRAYADLTGHAVDYVAAEREAKSLILTRNFAGELESLVRLAREIDGDAIDDEDLRTAITETIVAFPVYRTYGDGKGMPDADMKLLADTADEARRWGARGEAVGVLLRILTGDVSPSAASVANQFRIRFQQLTGPVMAKAVEDTLFYRYNRLIGLNEVGGDPQTSGSVESFHSAMQDRVRRQPLGLLATATHDTKRGEDARARLYAISEAPGLWSEAVARWRQMNSEHAGRLHDQPVPDAETEWLLYQSLAGVWPEELDGGALDALRDRFLAYLEKALREAKRHTSWIEIDATYEDAVKFYAGWLLSPDNRDFQDDFAATLRPFIRAGHFNSFSQTLIKMTAPGLPDIYQGCEMMDLSLVDPDNRRLPDFDMLERTLAEGAPLAAEDMLPGVLKQHLVAACLRLRRQMPALFQHGAYAPLEISGGRSDHVIAFMRSNGDDIAISVVPRLCFGFSGTGNLFVDSGSWDNTIIQLPPPASGRGMRNVFTQKTFDGGASISVGALLGDCPVALLVNAD